MQTKAYIKFANRIAHLGADFELVDVLILNYSNNPNSFKSPGNFLKEVDSNKHVVLANRKDSDGGRKNAFLHLKKTLYSSFVKDVYKEFTIYINSILEGAVEMSKSNPSRVVGDHNSDISIKKVLELGSWEKVVEHIAEKIMRRLEEERSTKKLISQMDKKLNLQLDKNIIDNAMVYLEIRHLLVHNDSYTDAKFRRGFGSSYCDHKNKIKLSFELANDMRSSIKNLVKEIDRKVISQGLCPTSKLQQ